MLLRPEIIAEVVEEVQARHFRDPANADIFDAIVYLWESGLAVEPQALIHELRSRAQLDGVTRGEVSEIGIWTLRDNAFSSDAAPDQARMVRNLAIKREAADAAERTIRRLEESPPQDAIDIVLKAAGLFSSIDLGWPPPTPLQEHKVARFPVDVLPRWLRDTVTATAAQSEVDAAVPGVMALSVLAAVCQRKFIFQRSGHREQLSAYGLVLLPSANIKSGAHGLILEPIERADNDARIKWNADAATRRARLAVLKKKHGTVTKAAADGDAGAEKELAKIEAEIDAIANERPAHLVVDNVTPESLLDALQQNQGRVLVSTDEGDFFERLGRYADGAPSLDTILKGHDGGTIRLARKGSGQNFALPRPAISLAIVTQPSTLQERIFRGSIERGLPARCWFAIPPSLVGHRPRKHPAVPTAIREEYGNRVAAMLAWPWLDPEKKHIGHQVQPDEKASKHFSQIMAWQERQLADGVLAGMPSWGGKWHGAVARIAALLHLAGRHPSEEPWRRPINAETMDSALQIGKALISHATAAHDLMAGRGTKRPALRLLEWIVSSGSTRFRASKALRMTREKWSHPNNADFWDAVDELEEHLFIKRETDAGDAPPKKGTKPPSPMFVVNPHVHRKIAREDNDAG